LSISPSRFVPKFIYRNDNFPAPKVKDTKNEFAVQKGHFVGIFAAVPVLFGGKANEKAPGGQKPGAGV
jgi:hypothetical protein